MGEMVLCFTVSMGKITLGKVGFEMAEKVKTYRLVLDNGKSIRVGPNTQLVDRQGDYVTLDEIMNLPPTTRSVMPLYLSMSTNGYPLYRQIRDDRAQALAPSDRKPWRSVARMVWEWRTGRRLEPGFLVRHIDGNRVNCHPDNLRSEGKPQKKPRSNKLRRHIDVQRMRSPGNHKVLGIAPWDVEPVCRVVPLDCTNVGLTEVFVVAHGST
jgi:hypothetical protein